MPSIRTIAAPRGQPGGGATRTGTALVSELRIYHHASDSYRWTAVRAVPLTTANGQIGSIPAQTYWNATANYRVEKLKTTFFVTAKNIFDLATAWAERHAAILQRTPPSQRAPMEARLHRIGIRWGVVPGARMTAQFPALGLPPKRIVLPDDEAA